MSSAAKSHLIRIKLPYAVFGIDYDPKSGRVTGAAPIAKWMIGKTRTEIRAWVKEKGGTVEDLGAVRD